MSESAKNPFDLLLEQFREIVREEIAALRTELNGNGAVDKDWLKASEAAQLYGLPKTWFEERGRAGDITRTKPGRYVLFARRDIERYLEEHRHKKDLTSSGNGTT
jgi:excisionase family DNA binding protein